MRPIALMEVENIGFYLKACWKLGVPSADLFVSSDLYLRKNIPQVVQNIASLTRVAQTIPTFKGPIFGRAVSMNVKPAKKWDLNEPNQALYVQDMERKKQMRMTAILSATPQDLGICLVCGTKRGSAKFCETCGADLAMQTMPDLSVLIKELFEAKASLILTKTETDQLSKQRNSLEETIRKQDAEITKLKAQGNRASLAPGAVVVVSSKPNPRASMSVVPTTTSDMSGSGSAPPPTLEPTTKDAPKPTTPTVITVSTTKDAAKPSTATAGSRVSVAMSNLASAAGTTGNVKPAATSKPPAGPKPPTSSTPSSLSTASTTSASTASSSSSKKVEATSSDSAAEQLKQENIKLQDNVKSLQLQQSETEKRVKQLQSENRSLATEAAKAKEEAKHAKSVAAAEQVKAAAAIEKAKSATPTTPTSPTGPKPPTSSRPTLGSPAVTSPQQEEPSSPRPERPQLRRSKSYRKIQQERFATTFRNKLMVMENPSGELSVDPTMLVFMQTVLTKLLFSQPVEFIDITKITDSLKTDTGRRRCVQILHETIKEIPTLVLSDNSFELLIFLLIQNLREIDSSDSKDLISARKLMMCSCGLSRRTSSKQEFISDFLRDHEIWKSTLYWSEYFMDDLVKAHRKKYPGGFEELDAVLTYSIMRSFAYNMRTWGVPLADVQQFIIEVSDRLDMRGPERSAIVLEVEKHETATLSDSKGKSKKKKEMQKHIFEDKKFSQAVHCHYCSKFILESDKAGLKCESCQYSIHKKCLKDALRDAPCGGIARTPSLEKGRESSKKGKCPSYSSTRGIPQGIFEAFLVYAVLA
eukprot:TRINITY_DN7485_c0_g1_i2.p1 TRINITY_DN7485_c0_g1~~TRINITY_DN7485_c0_g1_i2.p1  ORF type:complete len:915 (-),score=229.89 TRINITY_DN7485_c0_g1_i2:2550-4985(-)